MKKIFAVFFTLFISLSLLQDQISACTTFCLNGGGEVLFGKNYDWMIGDGMVFVNKRGVEKQAVAESAPNPAKWISKYGSVTFNQYGRENPSGGMNEAGLVIELMWLDETRYPQADDRPAVGTLEWIQYQLDTSASVEEVLKNAASIRIASDVKIHYLVADRQGNAGSVEFLDGRMIARTGDEFPVSALANDTYDKSLDYSKTVSPEKAKSESSFDRFTRAAEKARAFAAKPQTGPEAVSYAFDILDKVKQRNSTQWSIVYDRRRGRIHFRTRLSPKVKTVAISDFDYACGSPVKIFDINSQAEGDVGEKFSDYSRTANRDLVERAFSGTPFLKNIPPPVKDFLAAYPENFSCPVRVEQPDAQSRRDKSTSAGNFGVYLTPVIDACRSIATYLFS